MFGAFLAYKGLHPGNRTTDAVVAEVFRIAGRVVTEERIRQWSARWKWKDRARAWDEHVRAEADKAEIEARKSARVQHVKLASSLQAVGGNALAAIGQMMKAAEKQPAEIVKLIGPRDALRLVVEGVKLDRLVRGQTTETVGGPMSVAEFMAEQERRDLEEAREREGED